MAFDPNDKAAILAALQDEAEPDNPIAVAVLAKVQDCAEEIARRVEELGRQPDKLVVPAPETVLEAVAWKVAEGQWSEETGQALTITWVH